MDSIGNIAPNQIDRFWRRVDRSRACWTWQGPPNSNGYGQVSINRRTYLAHRLAYVLTRGAVPVGMLLRHTCDNRMCVNPDHLIPGTHEDNTRDAVQRKRMGPGKNAARGERAGSSRLTEREVTAIRTLYAGGGITQDAIARAYRVNSGTISRILTGKAWTHLPIAPTSQSSEPRKPRIERTHRIAHEVIPLPGFTDETRKGGTA